MKNLQIAAILLTAASLATQLTAQTIQVSKENRTIAITATDRVFAQADVATLHIGFIAYGLDSASAYVNGSRISNAIATAVNKAGVPAEDLESENQNISPVQDYQVQQLSDPERAQRKFQVVQSWTVRTNAKDAAGILDLAVKAGANQSGQIDWSLRDENAPRAEAAAKALTSARAQAEKMAASLNTHLGPLIYASNEIQAEPIRPAIAAMQQRSRDAAPAPLAINPRRVEKSATVYAVFAIE